jgi:hypothetical protein
MYVDVYRNLAKNCFSIRECKTRLVIAHVQTTTLHNAKFIVSEPGRQRVLKERRKNVHAYVRGWWKQGQAAPMPPVQEVSYNPYKFPYFYKKDDNSAVYLSPWVFLHDNKIFVPTV